MPRPRQGRSPRCGEHLHEAANPLLGHDTSESASLLRDGVESCNLTAVDLERAGDIELVAGHMAVRAAAVGWNNKAHYLDNQSAPRDEPLVRQCFICLEPEGDVTREPTSSPQCKRHEDCLRDLLLVDTSELCSCCSQCYTVAHRECWRQWRLNQKLAFLRAQLLDQNTPNLHHCSVCKTGLAQMEGEPNIFPPETECRRAERTQLHEELFRLIGRMLNHSDDGDEPPLCTPLVSLSNLALFSFSFAVDLVCILYYGLSAGEVVLWTILLAYYVSVVQLIVLSIYQRRASIAVFVTDSLLPREAGDTPSNV